MYSLLSEPLQHRNLSVGGKQVLWEDSIKEPGANLVSFREKMPQDVKFNIKTTQSLLWVVFCSTEDCVETVETAQQAAAGISTHFKYLSDLLKYSCIYVD